MAEIVVTGRASDIGVEIAVDGAAGVVTLDRPAALNAIDSKMRAAMTEALPRFACDPEIYAVVMRSAGTRAFSVGGDVRELARLLPVRRADACRMLAAEYELNWLIECFSKPVVSLIDGLAMGTGVGITLYGTHRVAGARYAFAMPETTIGFFPDDGVASVLARLPGEIGVYLGLTGRTIGRADAFRLGLVTHCLDAEHFEAVVKALAAAAPVDALLDRWHQEPGAGDLAAREEEIAHCFAAASVAEILDRLAEERRDPAATAWCRAVAGELVLRSPTALEITLRHIREARARDLRHTLVIDYRLACRLVGAADFLEGVRAVLVDRDRTPRWRPDRLADVSGAILDSFFAPMPGQELVLPTRQEMQRTRA